jgi:hypothetical protein
MGVPEVKKDHEWCPHARPGCGCAIYKDRPEACRDFHCMWLLDNRFKEYWKPNKCRIVINPKLDEKGKAYIAFVVDPDYPLRWREEPWFSDIKAIGRAGLRGLAGQTWRTFVMIRDERIEIVD